MRHRDGGGPDGEEGVWDVEGGGGDVEGGGGDQIGQGAVESDDPFPALAEQYVQWWTAKKQQQQQQQQSEGEQSTTPDASLPPPPSGLPPGFLREGDEGPFVLFLVGKMGNGKSTVGNLLLGDPSCFEHGRRAGAVTERCRVVASFDVAANPVIGYGADEGGGGGGGDDTADRAVLEAVRRQRGLMVVDTPGFGDPTRSVTSILSEIAWMAERADGAFRGLGGSALLGAADRWQTSYGVLVVLGCQTRLSIEDLDCVRSLRAVFGSAYLGQCASVVFTHGDLLDPEYALPSPPPQQPPAATATAAKVRPGHGLGGRPGVGGGLGQYLSGPRQPAMQPAAEDSDGLADARDLLSFARGGVLACTATDACSDQEAAKLLAAAIPACKGPVPPKPRGKKARRLRQARNAENEKKTQQLQQASGDDGAPGGCVLL